MMNGIIFIKNFKNNLLLYIYDTSNKNIIYLYNNFFLCFYIYLSYLYYIY